MRARLSPLALLLAALFLALPAFAAPPATASDDALMFELACNPNQSRATAEVDLEPTEPVFLTGCSAEKTDCFGSVTVSCTGNSSCSVECNGVICDSVLTECHSCGAGCNTPAYCGCRSCGGGAGQCFLIWCT